MRERFIELCENLILSCKSSLCVDCEHNNIDYPHCMGVHFADHLLANGVIVPPCKVGDTIYALQKERSGHFEGNKYVVDDEGEWEVCEKEFNLSLLDAVGEWIFLTREEAEQALKGGSE